MHILRPITNNDMRALENFAFTSDIGLISLPKNPELLEKKLLYSVISFSKEIQRPDGEIYLFILEDLASREAVGISGIYAKTGHPHPNYFYNVQTFQQECPFERTASEMKVLHPEVQSNNQTEIGSLFLLPEHRKGGLGRLLSLGRFLFMAAFPNRFESEVVAILRGYIKKDQTAPFWEGCGRRFCDISFVELMRHLDKDFSFIPKILPKHPIYTCFLPQETQESVGKIHENTQPALTLLMQEGFSITSQIDPFDGGPKLRAIMQNIRSFKQSRLGKVKNITSEPIASDQYIISNEQLTFRACLGSITQKTKDSITIQEEVAAGLQVRIGDSVRYTLAYPKIEGKAL